MASGFSYSEALELSTIELEAWIIAIGAAQRPDYDAGYDYENRRWRDDA